MSEKNPSHLSSAPDPSSGPDRKIWIDGSLVPWAQATVHLLSHALQRGSLVFDYMSVHKTPRGVAVFRLADHAERFLHSCELVGLPLERSQAEVEQAIRETVHANPGARSCKATAYIPSIEVDVVPQDERVTLAVAAYDPIADVIARNQGSFPKRATVRLWLEKQLRNRRDDIVHPHAKVAASYVSPMIAKWRARKAGFDEILLEDADGFLAEGPTTNFFLVDEQGTLCTPARERVLPGVTRRSIIELAKHDGIAVREIPLRPEALASAREMFLTGTSAGVWPVESVDGIPVGQGEGSGQPGPVTRRLAEHFSRITSGEDADFAHWLQRVDPAAR